MHNVFFFCFFFSSRRRHTRWPRDWSSDVCSSDLPSLTRSTARAPRTRAGHSPSLIGSHCGKYGFLLHGGRSSGGGRPCGGGQVGGARSEERRVGKECRAGWSAGPENEKRMKGVTL